MIIDYGTKDQELISVVNRINGKDDLMMYDKRHGTGMPLVLQPFIEWNPNKEYACYLTIGLV